MLIRDFVVVAVTTTALASCAGRSSSQLDRCARVGVEKECLRGAAGRRSAPSSAASAVQAPRAARPRLVPLVPLRSSSTPVEPGNEVETYSVSECDPPEHLKVLFIGNSYTIMHDLPHLVEELGHHAGIDLRAEMLATGGQGLEFHAAQRRTAEVIEEGDWDVVVLQGHSLDTLQNYEAFLEAGQTLAELARGSGAVPMLFQTWARKAGHELYANFEPSGGGPRAMQAAVEDGYEELARLTGADVVEVGRAWRAIRERAPQLDPYASDAAHPGKLGAYLTANVFFAALTDVSPVGNVDPLLGIDPETASLIQAQADAIVEPNCTEV